MSSYKKIKSTIMVPEDTYKETRILAIRRGMDIGSLVDEALREKIVRDYQRMGLQPPFSQTRSQSPSQQHDDTVIHSSRYEAAKAESKSNGPITTPQQQTSGQLQPPQQSPIFAEDMTKLSFDEYYKSGCPLFFTNFEYPIHKNQLVQLAKSIESECYQKHKIVPLPIELTSFVFERLPNREYKDWPDLDNDLAILVAHNKDIIDKLVLFGIEKVRSIRSFILLDMGRQGEKDKAKIIGNLVRRDNEFRRDYQMRQKQQRMLEEHKDKERAAKVAP